MYEVWNDFDLKKPPLITLPVKETQFGRHLHQAISKYLKRHEAQDIEFAETAALLSRLMARRKSSFRNMVGFRCVRKLNSSLCRLLRIDFPRDLESLSSAIGDEFCTELPSRNCLDFVLVRLLSVYHIHKRVRECCIEGADFFTKMIRTNFFLEISTLLLAIFAKLHSLSGVLGNKCATLYGQLLRHRADFPHAGVHQFLPDDIELPASLAAFRDTAATDTQQATAAPVGKPQQLSLAVMTPTPRLMTPTVSKFRQKCDVGEEVERTSKAGTTKFNISQLTTVADVKKFIKAENTARKASPTTCTTKDILSHEWAGAQKLFERKLLAGQYPKALSIFCKFLASKI